MRSFNKQFSSFAVFALLLVAHIYVHGQDDSIAVLRSEPAIVAESKTEAASESNVPAPAIPTRPDLTRVGVQTTDTVPLSLDDAIRRALQNNNSIEFSRDDVRFQETQITSLLGTYDPVFTVSPTLTKSSATGQQSTKDFNISSNFSQFLPTGGNYTAFFNNARNENAFTQAQVTSGSLTGGTSAIYSSNYGIRFTQPLFRNRGIDNTRRNIRIARRRLEQTDADFRRQAIETISQVQRVYWDLVFALRDQQNRVANLELTRENLRLIEARIAAGAAAPLARAEVETELANREGDLLIATQQVAINENALKQLMLREAFSPEWSQSIVPTEQFVFDQEPISLDVAVKDAIDNRFELRRLRFARDINEIDIEFFRNQTRPQIDLNTSFSLVGLARSGPNEEFTSNFFTSQQDLALLAGLNQVRGLPAVNLPQINNPTVVFPPAPSFLFGGFGQALANTFRSDAPNWSVGVTISFPLRNRTARANLAGAQIQRNQLDTQMRSQEQVVIVEVRNAVQAVETARQRVLIARRARENAQIQLDGERRLVESGRSTTFLLFQRENALANARNAEIRAETDYNKALSDLQRATSSTFRANNIIVDSPADDN
ncbi:MAG: TolC family protein [Blastocatellia bacterium]|nr:TolC family protein [Blastocatellia bacterium]